MKEGGTKIPRTRERKKKKNTWWEENEKRCLKETKRKK